LHDIGPTEVLSVEITDFDGVNNYDWNFDRLPCYWCTTASYSELTTAHKTKYSTGNYKQFLSKFKSLSVD